jgi:CRP-like cAMP-binding protein
MLGQSADTSCAVVRGEEGNGMPQISARQIGVYRIYRVINGKYTLSGMKQDDEQITDLTPEKVELLEKIALFADLPPAIKTRLAGLMEPISIPRYHFIYRKDDTVRHLYLLAEGAVKIGTLHFDGREIIKQILHPEAIFGELGLICEDTHHNYALTFNTEVRIYRIEISAFREVMQESPDLHFKILSMIGRRLKYTEKRLESLIFKDARERIVEFLRYQAETHGRRVGFETYFRHSFTQQDIANFTGTSRQTVTSVLNALRKSNMIHFNRRGVLIRDLANLR